MREETHRQLWQSMQVWHHQMAASNEGTFPHWQQLGCEG
jgi:hypothetical protein